MFVHHPFRWLTAAAVAAVVLLSPSTALAHCDGLDGPVVAAARTALDTKNVDAVLIWVLDRDEAAVRDAFQRTLKVRAGGPDAKALADTWFFETVVRLHRAGEGEPYTGLKPAGRDLGPAIPAADKALEVGSDEALLGLLTDAVRTRVAAMFEHALHARHTAGASVAKGREYVKAYVTLLHTVEGIYNATAGAAHGHPGESTEPPR